jgi:hypothetical protein
MSIQAHSAQTFVNGVACNSGTFFPVVCKKRGERVERRSVVQGDAKPLPWTIPAIEAL